MSLRVGLIGAGHMGRIHLKKLSCMEGVEISGILDIDKATAEELSSAFNCPLCSELGEIINNSDGVIIATPTETHFEFARLCLENGINTFIEKPIASTVDEARELVKLSEQKGLILQIGHLERFNPAFRYVKPYIEEPVLIEARRTSNFTGRSVDIDVVLDLMVHDIDLLLSIKKTDIVDIQGKGVGFVGDKLDVASVFLKFKDGTSASLFSSRISDKKERVLNIFERDRFLYVDLLSGHALCNIKKDRGEIEEINYRAGIIDSVKEELTEFINSICGMGPVSVKGEDGLNALMLANRIKDSIG
ncbi:MAG: Gfo/Idh/MocA family oxidoreductase [Syntrophorhabdaceae bacterium]|nr:Gfo/Idh/MocA family oxidoreductase [Syntrophorhabdaceae bacterium]